MLKLRHLSKEFFCAIKTSHQRRKTNIFSEKHANIDGSHLFLHKQNEVMNIQQKFISYSSKTSNELEFENQIERFSKGCRMQNRSVGLKVTLVLTKDGQWKKPGEPRRSRFVYTERCLLACSDHFRSEEGPNIPFGCRIPRAQQTRRGNFYFLPCLNDVMASQEN